MKRSRNLVYITVTTFSFLLNLALALEISSTQELQDTTYFVSYCSEYANYDQGSEFQNNLHLLSSNLTRKANTTNFYNFTVGETPNKVYGLFFCDNSLVANQSCLDCVRHAIGEIQQRCEFSKVYLVWYVGCMLRYSDYPISYANDLTLYYNFVFAPVVYGEFNQTLSDALTSVINDATAANTSVAPSLTVVDIAEDLSLRSYAGCSPDLSTSDCTKCLQIARDKFLMIGAAMGVLLQPSCKLAYIFNDARSFKLEKGA